MDVKRTIRIDVGESREFDAQSYSQNHTRIPDLISWLSEVQNLGATHIDWYARAYDGDSEEVTAQPFYNREETDEEYSKRIETAEKQAKQREVLQEMHERLVYEQLKNKFEKQSNPNEQTK